MNTDTPDDVAEYRMSLRARYDLPELRFSDIPDRRQARTTEMYMAFQDANVAESFGEFGEAFQYTQAAIAFGLEVFDREHEQIRMLRDHLRHIEEREGHAEDAMDES